MGFGVFLGTFCTSKKYPGARGRVAPVGKYPGPGRVGPGRNPGSGRTVPEKPRSGAGQAQGRIGSAAQSQP